MSALLLWLSLIDPGYHEVVVTVDMGAVPVACTVGSSTRIRLSGPIRQVKTSSATRARFGLRFASFQPHGEIVVSNCSPGARGQIRVVGENGTLHLRLAAVPATAAADPASVDPASVDPASVDPAAQRPRDVSSGGVAGSDAPAPADGAPVQQPPSRAPRPLAEPTVRARDLRELLSAKPVRIGRREGLPGQREVELVDALRGDEWVYLRFVVRGGAGESIDSVSVDGRELEGSLSERDGGDLRLIVPVAREGLEPSSRVELSLGSGASYRFPLSSPTFVSFLRSLF